MKKITTQLLALFLLVLSPKYVNAFTNSFNVTINEELITLVANPGKAYPVSLHLDTMSTSQTAYLFGLNLPNEASYSSDTWISPNSTSVTLNNQSTTKVDFTVMVPNDLASGEYHQALVVADQPLNDNEDNNPTTMVAVPLIIQVSPNAEESITTTSSSSSTETTNNQSQTPTNISTNTSLLETNKILLKPAKKPKTDKKQTNLFSYLKVISIKSVFQLFKLQTNFIINITNDGNIYSIPSGSVQVSNLKNNVIQNIPINTQKSFLSPQKNIIYTVKLTTKPYTLGLFKARLNLSSKDSQTEKSISVPKSIYFFHIGLIPLIISLLILYILITNIKYKKAILYFLLLILAIFATISQNTNPKYLSLTKNLNITAEVKNQIGLKSIVNNDQSKTIIFTNTNPLGSTLYSLKNGSRTALGQVTQHTYGNYSKDLNHPYDLFPLMMVTTGY